MSTTTVTPRDALSRLLAAAKQINADECKDERVFHALQGEIAVAEGVLRDYVEPKPVAWASFADNGNIRIWSQEPLVTFGFKTQPLYAEPVAAQSAVAAASVPASWCVVEKATHYALHEGNTVVASLAGPEAEANAAIIARAIVASRAAPLHEAGNAAAEQETDDRREIIDAMIDGVDGCFRTALDSAYVPSSEPAKAARRQFYETTAALKRTVAIALSAPSIAAPTEVERDAKRLDFIENNTVDLRCYSPQMPGCDDADVYWNVIEHHMAEPNEREIGWGNTARQAIDAAIATGEKHD